MNANVTVTLPNELFLKAEAWAQQSGRPIEDFLSETIEASLTPFVDSISSLCRWSDQEVLDTVNLELLSTDDRQLSALLQRQSKGALSLPDEEELHQLMTKYQQALLLKSAAIREAVKRGLRPPLGS
jgi:hypothetical protein